jgi:hypothetical protein
VEISRPNETTILLARIDPVIAELMRRIVASADPEDNEKARARIFSAPTEDPKEDDFKEDWQEFVEPELAKLFQSAIETIDGDLKKMHVDTKTGESTLPIPSDHLESWIHGLNQARLVLSEKHKLHEEDFETEPMPPGDPRALLLLQMHLYAQLQLLFLRLQDRG